MLVDNGGTNNTVNVGTASSNAGALISSGTLTLAQSTGTTNSGITAGGFSGGTLMINQNNSITSSTINLTSGSSSATNATVNQSGSYQNATLTTNNGSQGTFNLNTAGTAGTAVNLNLAL